MAKPLPKKKTQKKKPEKPPLIPEKYQNIAYIFVLTLSVFIFFAGAIAGGGFNEFDNVSSLSFVPYLQQAAANGNDPLWVPYIFSGMPGYAALLVTGERIWDIAPMLFFAISGFFKTLFANDTARIAIYYSLYAAGIFLFMRFKKHDRVIAFLSAFAAVFSTWVITWVMIGHNTKPVVLALFPFVFLFMEKLREKFSLLYAVLLIIAVHLMFEGGHFQMIFYGGIAFALYLVFEFVSRLINKTEPMQIVRVAGLLVVAAVFSYLMAADRYLSVQEYTPYSTRGSAPILKTANQHQNDKGGNDYEYATMWSYSPMESWTFLVPGYFGHGLQKWLPKGAPAANEQLISTYWGAKETEDSPPYMGILVLALAILGFVFYRKDAFVQFLLVLIVFAWLLGMGKNLSFVYDIFYYNFPNFNKFRAPSMAFALLHFAVPLLAGYGLAGIFKMRKEFPKVSLKPIKIFMYASGGFLGLGLVFIALFKDSYMSAVAGSRTFKALAQQANPQIISELQDFVWSGMVSDWLIGAIILIAGAVLSYMFVQGKLSKAAFGISLFILFAFDLWHIDYKRMNVAEESVQEEVFQRKADVYNFIKQDKDVFRVADFSSNPANIPAYFLVENINGYHAAKLRIYQDVLDVAQQNASTSYLFNPFLWNILNVKFIITNRPFGKGFEPIYTSQASGDYVYLNSTGLPRAFFVKSAVKSKQMDILKHLKNGDFNPLETVYVETDLSQKIEPFDSTAAVKVTKQQNEYIKIDVDASGNNFLFISEIYYPAGWKAFIDGKETPIIKSNYAFRGVIVPKGKHSIEMKFASAAFEQGKTISIAVNIIIVLALVAGIFLERRKKQISAPNKQDENIS